MAIGIFLRKLLRQEEISVYGTGTGRDYTYIDDIVNGIVFTLESKHSDVYNLGSHAPVLMTELLDELRRYFPAMRVKQEEGRMGDVTSTWADITKAQTKLGYQPSVSFEEGLERTVVWARKHAHLL
ncbi:hypothetical protein GCM10020331_033730 [Ectobacillus funiculus]